MMNYLLANEIDLLSKRRFNCLANKLIIFDRISLLFADVNVI